MLETKSDYFGNVRIRDVDPDISNMDPDPGNCLNPDPIPDPDPVPDPVPDPDPSKI